MSFSNCFYYCHTQLLELKFHLDLSGMIFFCFDIFPLHIFIISACSHTCDLSSSYGKAVLVWFRSFLRGGSVGIFMFLYSFYFYSKSSMSGFMQTVFYFGYSASMCYAFFLMLGTVSFYTSLTFVRRIYHAVKSEWACCCVWPSATYFAIFLLQKHTQHKGNHCCASGSLLRWGVAQQEENWSEPEIKLERLISI